MKNTIDILCLLANSLNGLSSLYGISTTPTICVLFGIIHVSILVSIVYPELAGQDILNKKLGQGQIVFKYSLL